MYLLFKLKLLLLLKLMVNVYDKMITVALVSNWILMLVIPSFVNCQVYVSLGSKNFTTNNTEVLITRIEEDLPEHLPTLTCHTDLTECCRTVDTGDQGGRGEWYYPDGRMVQNNSASTAAEEGFYRVRNAPRVIRLARRHDSNPLSPTGSYCCVIPTTRGEMTFCINIVVCQPLSLTNGMISYSDPTLGVGSVATQTCDTGYRLNTLSDQNTRICRRNTSWSGLAVNCMAIEDGSITMELPSSPSQENDTTIANTTESEDITTVLAAAFGVLVTLVAVIILITACLIVHKKRSATHQHSHQSPSTKENECYSIRRLADPQYDDATFTQLNCGSINPAYHMEAVNDKMTHSYDYIEQPQGTNYTLQSNTPVRMEASEIDFYDTEQHTYEVIDA